MKYGPEEIDVIPFAYNPQKTLFLPAYLASYLPDLRHLGGVQLIIISFWDSFYIILKTLK